MDESTIGSTQPERAKRNGAANCHTTGAVLPEGRPNKLHDSCSNNQQERAKQNGVSYQTQQRLDWLARHAPEQLEKVRAGKESKANLALDRQAMPGNFPGIVTLMCKLYIRRTKGRELTSANLPTLPQAERAKDNLPFAQVESRGNLHFGNLPMSKFDKLPPPQFRSMAE